MAQPRVTIVGAGPAGTRAAELLVAAGLHPLLVDEAADNGGQIYRRQPAGFRRPPAALYGTEAGRATALHASFDALRGRIEHWPESLAWNLRDGVLHVLRGERSHALPFDALILATGATDRLIPLPGWTLPGVFTLGGAQIALKAQACAIGRRVAFLGSGPLLYLVAAQYAKAGAEVAAVLDTAPAGARWRALPLMAARPALLAKGAALLARLRRAGVPVHRGVTPLRLCPDASGARLGGIAFRQADGREAVLDCDASGLGWHLRAETQLAGLAGCGFDFDRASRQWLPRIDADGRSEVPGLYMAGDGVRLLGADGAEIAGRLAALAVLRDLGFAPPAGADPAALRRRRQAMDRFRRGLAIAFPWPAQLVAGLPDETLVCRCEAITAGELRRSAGALDAPEVNRAKAFSRVGMGRCQGRMCGLAGAEILAAARGVPVEEVGRLRGQAPVKPLPVAALREEEA
ncbi:FAD/NAD(P)-binding oxidoreductase [Roseomonas sp. E05]|uniref:NAD(P)/FAD-dependent oxidoreductase n=1 Tax=Roseomonas sp. E05 TaxID=3046310 RepID=UPI0024BA55DF|nr:FAD/NAD(P)-binding oxidoreductase [Roseomonas sp. E05]MDJ0389064.1 FAD/NAD(P)-binding oxidoreductase [Roseomonas sp. E05]